MTTDHMPPPTPQELVSQMKESYQTFLEACYKLSSQQAAQPGICGEWSAKAVVDHLTGWQIESLPILKKILETDSSDFNYDIDAFNRTSVKDREDLGWEESLRVLQDSFESFAGGLDTIPVKRYRTNAAFKSWLKAMVNEYQFHIQHIQQAQGQ